MNDTEPVGGQPAAQPGAPAPQLPPEPQRRGAGCGTWSCIVVFVLLALLFMTGILPGIIVIKDGRDSFNAEVKQNLHSIQLALERYAVDNGGNYPYFLYGGSTLINTGVMAYYNPSGKANQVPWDQPVHIPFDTLWLQTHPYGYHNADWDTILNRPQDLQNSFGDALAYEGYMPKYPQNPFQRPRKAEHYGLQALNTSAPWFAGYGGAEGNLMWDLSLGMSELPQLQAYADEEDGTLAFPGNFYYHARFADDVTSSGHCRRQALRNPGSWMPAPPQGPPLNDQHEVQSSRVRGYDLVAVGSPRTKGMDIDDSVAGAGLENYWRTGYFTLGGERNPWVRKGDYPGAKDYAERPSSDGVPDYFIIHLHDDANAYPAVLRNGSQ